MILYSQIATASTYAGQTGESSPGGMADLAEAAKVTQINILNERGTRK